MYPVAAAVASFLLSGLGTHACAQLRRSHSGADVNPTQLPFWTAKELGNFEKYRLSVGLDVLQWPRSDCSSPNAAMKQTRLFITPANF